MQEDVCNDARPEIVALHTGRGRTLAAKLTHPMSFQRRAGGRTALRPVRIHVVLTLTAVALAQSSCVTLGKGISGSLRIDTDPLKRYKPSDTRDLAWLAGYSAIHVFVDGTATPQLEPGGSPKLIWHHYVPPQYSDATKRLCDYYGRKLCNELRAAFPGCHIEYSSGVPSDGLSADSKTRPVVVCCTSFKPVLYRSGQMTLLERPAVMYLWPAERSRWINEAHPLSQRNVWRARPGAGAERSRWIYEGYPLSQGNVWRARPGAGPERVTARDAYEYQLDATGAMAQVLSGWNWSYDLPAAEEEIRRFADRRANDLALQVREAVESDAMSD